MSFPLFAALATVSQALASAKGGPWKDFAGTHEGGDETWSGPSQAKLCLSLVGGKSSSAIDPPRLDLLLRHRTNNSKRLFKHQKAGLVFFRDSGSFGVLLWPADIPKGLQPGVSSTHEDDGAIREQPSYHAPHAQIQNRFAFAELPPT